MKRKEAIGEMMKVYIEAGKALEDLGKVADKAAALAEKVEDDEVYSLLASLVVACENADETMANITGKVFNEVAGWDDNEEKLEDEE